MAYLVKFALIFIPLYYFNLFFWGITDPRNYYSPFADHYLNYISLITASILHTSNFINHLLGIHSVVQGNVIGVYNVASLTMEPPCVGLGIMSFWVALILPYKSSLKRRIYWCIGGVIAIWFINCCRVSLLMYSLQKNWNTAKYIDEHDLFNYAAYAVVLLLIYLFNTDSNRKNNELVMHAS